MLWKVGRSNCWLVNGKEKSRQPFLVYKAHNRYLGLQFSSMKYSYRHPHMSQLHLISRNLLVSNHLLYFSGIILTLRKAISLSPRSSISLLLLSVRPLQNGHFGSKMKNAKKKPKNVFTRHCSCSMQKTTRKNSWYSENETILKIGKNGQQATVIINLAKWSLWTKN